MFPYLSVRASLAFVALFAFDNLLGQWLHFVGYDSLTLLKDAYAYASTRISEVKFVDFQLLEIVAWFSIGAWGVRLILGLIFLKQYDARFGAVSARLSTKVYGALFVGAAGLWAAVDVKTQLDTVEFQLLMANFPRVYFSLMSVMWFWSLWGISTSLWFIAWKLFRQNWPGAVLWREQNDPEERA